MFELRGPDLFLRYAFPCAEDRLHAGRISQDNFKTLKEMVKGEIKVETFYLSRCYPGAVKSLENFAISQEKIMWEIETVAEFWRHHHGHTGDCAVVSATVCFLSGDSSIRVISGSKTFTAINLYNFDLQIGNLVYIHRKTIIEKVN